MIDSFWGEIDSERSDSDFDVDDNDGDSVPTCAEVVCAINTIKKYIFAADGDFNRFGHVYELEEKLKDFTRRRLNGQQY
ncbi:Protein of unknown function [Gryllus bimaculatus]|nr:Protein of unknown function [Gryllus bimaculatus]